MSKWDDEGRESWRRRIRSVKPEGKSYGGKMERGWSRGGRKKKDLKEKKNKIKRKKNRKKN